MPYVKAEGQIKTRVSWDTHLTKGEALKQSRELNTGSLGSATSHILDGSDQTEDKRGESLIFLGVDVFVFLE